MKAILTLATTVLLGAAPASAATLTTDNSGKLTGATGINVAGTSYDVSFIDGTCASVFSGCDANSDFAFNTDEAAGLAAQALLDQVFLGTFDTSPSLTRGCTDTSLCSVFIPVTIIGNFARSTVVYNVSDVPNDGWMNAGAVVPRDHSFIPQGDSVWGRFSLSSAAVSAVPEPTTWAMMIVAFGAMGLSLRRRHQTNNGMEAA